MPMIQIYWGNINTIKKNKKAPTDAGKKVGLTVNTEKTKCILLSHHQNAGENYNIRQLTEPLKMWQS
jgi:hypothetical protein